MESFRHMPLENIQNCRNLADAGYDVFYFKSIGNEFVQRGRPRTFGITLNINL